jgi:hypothetical protein
VRVSYSRPSIAVASLIGRIHHGRTSDTVWQLLIELSDFISLKKIDIANLGAIYHLDSSGGSRHA